jgi:hypothetical protein
MEDGSACDLVFYNFLVGFVSIYNIMLFRDLVYNSKSAISTFCEMVL